MPPQPMAYMILAKADRRQDNKNLTLIIFYISYMANDLAFCTYSSESEEQPVKASGGM